MLRGVDTDMKAFMYSKIALFVCRWFVHDRRQSATTLMVLKKISMPHRHSHYLCRSWR